MIVDVFHPAPVTYVPRGGRSPKHAYVATRTPVEIVSVPDREVREVGRLRSMPIPPSLHEHRGLLWERLTHVPYLGGRRNVRPDEWAAWLSGLRAPDHVATLLSNALAMSPLAALDHGALARRVPGGDFGRRGEAIDPASLRSMPADGRDEAASAVGKFLTEETLVTGTAVHVRYRPVAHERGSSPAMVGTSLSLDLGNLPLSPRHAVTDITLMTGKANLSAAGRPLFAEDLRTLDPFIEDDVDVRLLANWLPGELAMICEERSKSLLEADERGRARATRREVEGLGMLGDIGGIGMADARDVLDRVTKIAHDELHGVVDALSIGIEDIVRPSGLNRPRREEMFCRALHHLRHVLERTAPQTEPDDEAAMAGLEGPR